MKYLLDTSVLSQYRKSQPDPAVDAWLGRIDPLDLFLCDITIAELWYGIHLMPASRKRLTLQDWVENKLVLQFEGRILAFDTACAAEYGLLMARANKRGHNAGVLDGMIAATAIANSMAVATLNRKDFERLGVPLVEF